MELPEPRSIGSGLARILRASLESLESNKQASDLELRSIIKTLSLEPGQESWAEDWKRFIENQAGLELARILPSLVDQEEFEKAASVRDLIQSLEQDPGL